TAIVGHNGTMKTTILGILSQTFTLSKDVSPMYGEQTIDGYNFHSQFKEKFKMTEKDIPGEHKWRLDLYENIYKNDSFEAHSIRRGGGSNSIRFWSTEGRAASMNYPQVPAYYLSLKRVTPIGEEKNISINAELSEEEKEFLITEYKSIFSVTASGGFSVETISSKNKHSAAIHSNSYDAVTISAGQDNVAKLLLAILSFKRLKEKFPQDYRGGILLIDEIESTFHPLAQQLLIKRIYKYAKDYKIQFIFTTHSPSVIKAAFHDKYNSKDSQLLYLKRIGETVKGFNNPKVDEVIAELSGEVLKRKRSKTKIDVYCEDVIARKIVSNWLNDYKSMFKLSSCSLGAESYIELIRVKMDSIISSVVILDGDKNAQSTMKKLEKSQANNVAFLPSNYCPEKMFYAFLYSLDEEDSFWDNRLGHFDKTKCFAGFSGLLEKNAQTNEYKKWYEARKNNFGQNLTKLLNYWKIKNPEEYNDFIQSFIKAYNNVANKCGKERITVE
ncbi:MAG: ATP-binding protein, partial [Clostridia bacterium]|nr:ATP-binding protein [Clostridia bacterium]